MRVELGNPVPTHAPNGVLARLPGPNVVYVQIPDDVRRADAFLTADEVSDHPDDLTPHYGIVDGADMGEIAMHLARNPGPVTHLPGHEAFLVVRNSIIEGQYAGAPPSWISVPDNPEFERQLCDFYGAAHGKPSYVEDTHFTLHPCPGGGAIVLPPGVGPNSLSPVDSNTDAGRNMRWQQMLGLGASGGILGFTGTATATSATTLTGGSESGPTHAANDAAGSIIVAANGVYGFIRSHTSGTTPVFTVDRWYTPQTPGGSAASTPGATTVYMVITGAPPCLFMGITADATAVGSGDTTLPSEITTVGGGLIRKIAAFTHAAGATTGTVVATFTANGTDSLPVTVAKMGIGPGLLSNSNQIVQTVLGSTAVLSSSGDNLTLTDTWTI